MSTDLILRIFLKGQCSVDLNTGGLTDSLEFSQIQLKKKSISQTHLRVTYVSEFHLRVQIRVLVYCLPENGVSNLVGWVELC